MKSIYTLIALLFSLNFYGQVPQKFSYQAVVRNANSQLVSSNTVGVKISILQGNSSGTVVYSETHSPITNANGLFSIEIGGGSMVSGNFSSINWSEGPFFIKSEVDIQGGSDYTIEGVTQLLSVPYALYAEKAGNVFSGNYQDLTNKPDFATQKALNDSLAALRMLIENLDKRISRFELKVGDFKDGGIVGYIFQEGDPGYVAGEEHGLIVALVEQSKPWSAGGFTNVTGTSGNLGTGAANTAAILASSGGDNAANYCKNYVSGDYDDWFLPSATELVKIWINREAVNAGLVKNSGAPMASSGFGAYWTSTHENFNWAVALTYNSGITQGGSKSTFQATRPMRQF